MIWGCTGHRPDKLGGYALLNFDALVRLARRRLKRAVIEKMITGMALGWDQAVAKACIQLNIPFTAAIPFKGQELKWPELAQEFYWKLLNQAKEQVIVCKGGYAPWKMQMRNEYIVNRSRKMLTLWNGSDGGTANCVRYARQQGVEVVNVWDLWEKENAS